jgi:HAE1 family hydrophobic/amphiphilic exporter-1
MNFTDLFIRRAITTTLLMLSLLIFGIIAYRALPVSDLPPVDYPTIQVQAALPGASPETMATTVATPLERQFSTIAGIDSMSSSSSLGRTTITIQFSLDRDIDAAAQDVQAAISQASRSLPPNMPAPPSYNKVNPADQPILYMSVKSKTMPMYKVDEYVQTLLAQRISMVSGVAQVMVYGQAKYAVRVQVDPERLAAYSLGLDEVRDAITRGNLILPSGALYGPAKAYNVEARTQLSDAAGFRPLIVTYRNGNPVRLEQLGRVIDSIQQDKSAFWSNLEPSETLAVQKQPGTNTVAVVDGIKALLPALRAQIPAGIELSINYDRSQSIRESIAEVKFTLLLTIALVIFVIFVFLRNFSATVIPSLAVPLSLLGTFAAMYLLKFNVDILSLMAMTLSVGFVVDDAIVMLENIVRHREMGKSRLQAALEGAREIGFTIVSMTLSLVAVFIPVLFLGGIIGRLLREFAITISVAILISGVISLTLTPMLCSRFLRHGSEEKHHSRLFLWSERGFRKLAELYNRSLLFVLRHKFSTLAINIALALVTAYFFYRIPKDFLPPEDTGILFGATEAAEDTSFQEMAKLQRRASEVILRHPAVAVNVAGVGGFGPTNSGFLFIRLKDRSQRPSAQDILQQLRRDLAQIPGLNAYLRLPALIQIGGVQARGAYVISLQDADTAVLYRWAPRVEAKLRSLTELQDVVGDLRLRSPRVRVEVDRDRAQALGVTPQAIADTLFSAYGNRQVSTINTAANEYYVILEVLPEKQTDPNVLSQLYVRSSSGRLIPLSAVTQSVLDVAPLSVNHYGQLPAVNISFNLRPGVALGDALNRIREAVDEIGVPPTVNIQPLGAAQAFQDSLRGLTVLLIMAVVVIYIVLGILYESFIHPITILSGLPSAGFGALATLLLFNYELSLYGFVGLMLLIGIVKKNAIMMIDFALEAERQEGKSPEEAIYQGCLQRFRPIMMTTMAALLGSLPIAIGLSAGAEARKPLGLAVVGGLVVSQLLTLYLTPVVYVYLDRFERWFMRRKRRQPASTNWQEQPPVGVSR